MNIVALAGGVGGAKLSEGLAQSVKPDNLTIIVNTGDDFEHLGLKISPDVDTVCYTLAGIADPETGWGRAGETWNTLSVLIELGGPDWFRLGDHDLGTHLERTRRLDAGESLSQITQTFCHVWGVKPSVIPMSDDPVSTQVITDEGILPFQEYFVHRQCQPHVTGFSFTGIDVARPAPGVLESILRADLVVLCPSNPWVSIDPILAVSGIREILKENNSPIIAVSPIIGGKAVKGPAAKMYTELGIPPSARAVAQHYGNLLTGFVVDRIDADNALTIQQLGLQILMTDTIMTTSGERRRLAEEVVEFGLNLIN